MDSDKRRSLDNFHIKAGYQSREAAISCEVSLVEVHDVIHQPDVYALVAFLAKKFNCSHVLDIGCGRGYELSKLHPDFALVGVDFGSNIAYCRTHYPFVEWLELDLEQAHPALLPKHVLSKTLIVCSDVIEHLCNPNGLLKTLENCLQYAPVAIVTTPERDLVRGYDDCGPPANHSHVREWSLSEFSKLLKEFSFNIAFLGLTFNNNRDFEKKSIMSIVHGLPIQHPKGRAPESFRVVAFMTIYNEEDIVLESVNRLIRGGVEVYVIDNWSTDNSINLIEHLLGKGVIGIEQFPIGGATGTYDWRALLERVETLSNQTVADWFIHHDVDEIRESPWLETPLRDAIYHVDNLGFNAIDHTVINFEPIDNSFQSGSRLGTHFKYWSFGERPGHFQQIKAWKNLGQKISLAETGGHDASFTGRKVFPYKFLLRHYPVRSQFHGEKKILLERKLRFNAEERNILGWHTHYDEIQISHNFLKQQNSLHNFDSNKFYKEYLVERISGIGIPRMQKNLTKKSILEKLAIYFHRLFKPL